MRKFLFLAMGAIVAMTIAGASASGIPVLAGNLQAGSVNLPACANSVSITFDLLDQNDFARVDAMIASIDAACEGSTLRAHLSNSSVVEVVIGPDDGPSDLDPSPGRIAVLLDLLDDPSILDQDSVHVQVYN